MEKKVYILTFEYQVNCPVTRGVFSSWRTAFQSMLYMLSQDEHWIIEGTFPADTDEKMHWLSTETGEVMTVWIEEYTVDDKFIIPDNRYADKDEE